jgi:hypothetical protein
LEPATTFGQLVAQASILVLGALVGIGIRTRFAAPATEWDVTVLALSMLLFSVTEYLAYQRPLATLLAAEPVPADHAPDAA